MGTDEDALLPQRRNGDGAGRHQRGGDPPAEMSAAAVVFISVILGPGRQVRVTGTGGTALIIPAAGIRVGNQDCHGGAGGPAVENAADDAEGIRFLPGGGDAARRAAERQLGRNPVLIHGNTGCEAVDDRADFRSVAFAEEGDGEGSAKGVFHDNPTILMQNSECRIRLTVFAGESLLTGEIKRKSILCKADGVLPG